MSCEKQTPEPWKIAGRVIYDAKGSEVVRVNTSRSYVANNEQVLFRIEALERIVLCVNACAGLPKEVLNELPKYLTGPRGYYALVTDMRVAQLDRDILNTELASIKVALTQIKTLIKERDLSSNAEKISAILSTYISEPDSFNPIDHEQSK